MILSFLIPATALIHKEDLANFLKNKKSLYIKYDYEIEKDKSVVLRKYENEFIELKIVNYGSKIISDEKLNSFTIISKDSLLHLFYTDRPSGEALDTINLFILSKENNKEFRVIAVKPILVLED
jgi:hypothetical protein